MELKKSTKADLENKRGLFLEIGLLLSILLIIGAFAYNQKDRVIEIPDMGIEEVEEEIVEITVQEEKKVVANPVKNAVAVRSEILNIVTNDTKIEAEMDFTEFTDDIIVAPSSQVGVEAPVEEEIFLIAEDMPQFQGGDIMKFRKWVLSKLVYPTIAKENGISGRVTLQFVIEKDGKLSGIQILQNPDKSLADEAVRVLNSSPLWTPGKQRNVPVRVKYTLPVDFKLQN